MVMKLFPWGRKGINLGLNKQGLYPAAISQYP